MIRKAKNKASQPKVSPKLIKKASKIFKKSLKEIAKKSKIRAKAARKAAQKKKMLSKLPPVEQPKLSIVVTGNGFEGAKRIDHLPLDKQIDTVFNPLHSVTNTTVSDAVSEGTFIVHPKDKPKG